MDRYTLSRRQYQRGHTLLAMVTAFGIFTTAAVTALGSVTLGERQSGKTSAVLAQAKQALIGRAASDANHPGSLPCPDAATNIAGNNVPNDGIADLLSGPVCPSSIGRLPWRTLGLPDLRDADGERLWYLLAPAYQDSTSKIINPGTSGQISGYACDDNATAAQNWPCDNPRLVAATPWVAVVFAPGKLLPAQIRDAAHAGDFAQFLESYNPSDPLRLRTAAGAAHNDRLTTISADDIFAQVQRRVAAEIQRVQSKYLAATAAQGQARLPWPAVACASSTLCEGTPLAPPLPATARGYLPSDDALLNQIMAAQGMTWFDHNHWRTTVTYLVDASCAGAAGTAPCGTALAATDTRPFPAGTTLVGGHLNTIGTGTRAVISFAGVAGGSAKTRIAFALQ